ncbi:hypothetical protein BROUX41_002618 [Berkeleyomyces rouxiae]|uniref:uncharacterized protein n=1 Tax=Berkeleyomyces rouxiae TaxID=2035830 RepID=UPI003B78D053
MTLGSPTAVRRLSAALVPCCSAPTRLSTLYRASLGPRTSVSVSAASALRAPTTASPALAIGLRHHRTSAAAMASSREMIPSTRIRVLRSVDAVRQWRRPHAADQRIVALVPTMGALHAGHESLIRAAARENHHVVVSIYLNPAQFGVHEDLDSYPVTWDADVARLAALDRELADDGVNMGRISAVFAPATKDMYPAGFPGQEVASKGSFVTITPVSDVLEGASRPTFFRGVATVCMKLFNAVQPNRVYFGQKDVQQTVVIKTMVRDFLMPIDVVVGATQREPDGLALSSRNVYLGARRRAAAIVLNRALQAAERKICDDGVVDRASVMAAAMDVMERTQAYQQTLKPSERVQFTLDYLSLADPASMQEIEVVDVAKGAVLSGAVKFLPVEEPQEGEDLGHSGGPAVRLIDNIIVAGRE